MHGDSIRRESSHSNFATLGVLGISDRWAALSDDESVASGRSADDSEGTIELCANDMEYSRRPMLATRDRTKTKYDYRVLRFLAYLLVLIFLLGVGMVAAGILDLARH